MTICLSDISPSENCLSYADRYCCKVSATTSSKSQIPKKRRVTFSDKVFSIDTEHVNDISPEEKAKRWLCGEDYFRTKIDLIDHINIGKHFGWHNANGHYCCGERTFVNINGETATVTMRGIRSDLES